MSPAGRRRLAAAIAAVALGLWLAAGVYTVPASGVGVSQVFGAVVDPAVPPGVHWWWPAPIGRVDRVEVTTSRSIAIGSFGPDEAQRLTAGLGIGRWLTGDTNILELRAKLSYRIARPEAWLFRSDDPEALLRDLVGAAVTEAASGLPVDDLLTSGRLRLVDQVQRRSQEWIDALGLGVQILGLALETIEPPANVIASFQDVQNARADRERAISDAEAYRNGVVPVARGEADAKLRAATAFREQRVNAARGAADAFRRLAEEHTRGPEALEQRLQLETLERVLPRTRRVVVPRAEPGVPPVRILE